MRHDGDGLNDFFKVSGQGIIDFEMEIFNRWGQMVFKSSNINEKWDGTFRGKDLPTRMLFGFIAFEYELRILP